MKGNKTELSFICIGFQKCGTTSLYDLLKQHSDIYLTEDVKEPMFYRVPFVRRILGRDWYRKRYFGHLEEAGRMEPDARRRASENVGLLTGRRGSAAAAGVSAAGSSATEEDSAAAQKKSSRLPLRRRQTFPPFGSRRLRSSFPEVQTDSPLRSIPEKSTRGSALTAAPVCWEKIFPRRPN